jgi:hypothetical protein
LLLTIGPTVSIRCGSINLVQLGLQIIPQPSNIHAARWFAACNKLYFVLQGEWYSVWKWLAILFLEMGSVGFLAGSTIFASTCS